MIFKKKVLTNHNQFYLVCVSPRMYDEPPLCVRNAVKYTLLVVQNQRSSDNHLFVRVHNIVCSLVLGKNN